MQILIPDDWQIAALNSLREGADTIVDAPTSAGKTFVFELFAERSMRDGQAIYTVPTRALANDKLLAWRQRGWDVGIMTGDVAHNTAARVVVATLETQRQRLLRGDGPRLLVLDEYQMISDPVRGLSYELAVALAPRRTQLLLLSGSVANPDDVAAWIARSGREVRVVRGRMRPVPLEEVSLEALPGPARRPGQGFWAAHVARALRQDLAPILIFAPRRRAAESLAGDLAAQLPPCEPLALSREQEQLAGEKLSALLRRRVAYHHSGLGYAVRAGVVEALARAGQLRVVTATTGLAAGINFSLRSVLVTEREYTTGNFQRQIAPHELLQMYGRAGRRGLDEIGYALFGERTPRLSDARPLRLRRLNDVDWPVFLGVMRAAAERGQRPFEAAAALAQSLFTTQPVALGVERSVSDGERACGLWVDIERTRRSAALERQMQTPEGRWEPLPPSSPAPLGEAFAWTGRRWEPALSASTRLEGMGRGNLSRLRALETGARRYGREIQLGITLPDASGGLQLSQNLRRALAESGGIPIQHIPKRAPQVAVFVEAYRAALETCSGGRLAGVEVRGRNVLVLFDYGHVPVATRRDASGRALLDPPLREVRHAQCAECPALEACNTGMTPGGAPPPALAWRELGLVERDGTPTRRGVIASFFHGGEGLAIAAGLEDEDYPIPDLVRDLADIRAGHRFTDDGSPFHGRLAGACARAYRSATIPGYLELGLPMQFGGGAGVVLTEILGRPATRTKFLSEELRAGDIERALLEWRSLLRHIAHAPDYGWDRWMALRSSAAGQVEMPTGAIRPDAIPALTGAQMRRVDLRAR